MNSTSIDKWVNIGTIVQFVDYFIICVSNKPMRVGNELFNFCYKLDKSNPHITSFVPLLTFGDIVIHHDFDVQHTV